MSFQCVTQRTAKYGMPAMSVGRHTCEKRACKGSHVRLSRVSLAMLWRFIFEDPFSSLVQVWARYCRALPSVIRAIVNPDLATQTEEAGPVARACAHR